MLETICDVSSRIGECPNWDEHDGKLYWIDLLDSQLHSFAMKNNRTQSIRLPAKPASFTFWNNTDLLITMGGGFYRLGKHEDKPQLYMNTALPDYGKERFNDGKCDAFGRFWVGTADRNGHTGSGWLYCLEPSGRFRRVLPNMCMSNGIAWSPSQTEMYHIDSLQKVVYSFKYAIETGTLSARRILIDFTAQDSLPDGLTVDEEGALWVAHWGGYKVTRHDPTTGALLDQITLPVANVTSCMFGGENLNELFITTADEGLSADHLLQQPKAGCVFRVKPGVRGMPMNRFTGILNL
ncbi:Sugar lactone lactonase YvrE [Virgibacillus subterraneus]|uniref:Sugar lactone lactonase YvrE n=1 Tax=Virgibacillus subterraneus TaxID=621109 RepID=A0A1H9G7F2_9BACI|nr:SMP-30/gluconolactonase/LRE family protein [Virgibacillus subterraneus]SEQ45994.1 Sugar lactone lactonase YvrE [Virgibacillus subterraneus]